MKRVKIILSGGGTGGHIYPAVATAEAITKLLGGDVDILFVGAEGKMEMEKVPALGYNIKGLPVAGLQRRLTAKNLLLPFKIMASVSRARKMIHEFKADVVVGFGGYASAPVLWSAQRMGIPTLIQEQNSYAGMTNKILASKADKICVAYDNMERFFPKEKITMTGNPLRGHFSSTTQNRAEAITHFGLSVDKPVILIAGGSLGTRTLNNMMKANLDSIVAQGKIQVIWQNGKYYDKEMAEFMSDRNSQGIWRGAFIDRMDLAYTAADIVVGRSGAGTVSELCLVGRPTIFVPSPNVSEDHQTKNAMALVNKQAALIIEDSRAVSDVFPTVMSLLEEPKRLNELSENMLALGIDDAAERVAKEVLILAGIRL